ncbi:MAG: hypothetical protein MUF76_14390 [Hydrogenophaga sp.]|jgi:hypothetical protein|nr:hypothetical protein [Hydrogenophaga sp.]
MTQHEAPRPEIWRRDAGSQTVAVLDIPGSLDRHRLFDLDVTLLVRTPQDHPDPWHELKLELDGRLQWQRRVPSHSPGQTDGLDYHCRVRLESGRALRIRALVAVGGSRVERLLIEAREDL